MIKVGSGIERSKCRYYTKELPIKLQEGSIIDLETTGIDCKKDEIIAFGVIEGSTLTIIKGI